MIDYSIEDAINIINSCDESFNPDTRHFNVRNVQRIENLDLIYKTFLYGPLMGIIKQDYNKFRLYFEHYRKSSKDISLVIAIMVIELLILLLLCWLIGIKGWNNGQ